MAINRWARRVGWACLAVAALFGQPLVAQEAPSTLSGRVFDRNTQEPVVGALVELEGAALRITSNDSGVFRLGNIPGGVYMIRVTHLAYGTHEQAMNIPDGSDMAVRIALSQEAIALEPVVVEVETQRDRRNRARGVRVNEVTSEEIEALISTSRTLADVLQQSIPSLRSVPSSIATGRNCIEFRSPATLRYISECRSPLTLLDGIRMYDPPLLFSTIDLGSIHRIELIPPAEAGAEYGSDSSFGVLLIETKSYATERVSEAGALGDLPPELRGNWNWQLEGAEHPSARVFLYSFLGNAAGLAVGLLAAEQCMDFDRLAVDIFNSSCGGWGTFGARSSAVVLPSVGAAGAAGWAGRTELSHGRFWPTAIAAGIAVLPGYALATSSTVEGFEGTKWVGRAFLLLGVPAATTLADYVYRKFSGGG